MINIIPHDHEIHDELLLLPVDELRLNFGTAFSKIVFTFRTAPSKKLVDENQGYNQTNRI